MVRLFTESTCDLSLELLQELGVGLIPMRLTLDGVEYVDRQDLSPQEFFLKLRETKALPTTSQVTPETYIKIMNDIREAGEEALFAVFSSALSGTYQSAVIASKEVDYPGIRVVDTKAASGGQGLIVHELAKMAKEGKSLDELEKKARWMSEHIEHLVIVENLEMLKRGGRISAPAAFMGGVMNVKPLIHMVDGKLIPFGKAKGRKKAIQTVVDEVARRCSQPETRTFFISHGDDPQGAQQLDDSLNQAYGVRAARITELGPIIGSHTGPGVLTLFFFNEDE